MIWTLYVEPIRCVSVLLLAFSCPSSFSLYRRPTVATREAEFWENAPNVYELDCSPTAHFASGWFDGSMVIHDAGGALSLSSLFLVARVSA